MIHTTPVCTSPNGFSAGPPFVLPGAAAPVVVAAIIYQQGTATLSTRVPGLTLSGPTGSRAGRSCCTPASRIARRDARRSQRPGRVRRDRRHADALLNALPSPCSSTGHLRSHDGLSRRQEDPDHGRAVEPLDRLRRRARVPARRRRRSRSPTSTTSSRIASSKIAAEFGTVPVLPCDVTKDDDIDALFAALGAEWGALDGLLHAIAFAPREALAGDFLEGMSRAAFATAHDVELYSFAALAKGARPLMQGRHGVAADAHLPRRDARAAELQRDGPRQGEPRGERPLPRRLPRPRGHPRQRHLGGPDQDARGRRHRRLLEDPAASSRRTRRCAATSRSTRSATSPRSTSRISRARSPARSPTSTADSRPSPRRLNE